MLTKQTSKKYTRRPDMRERNSPKIRITNKKRNKRIKLVKGMEL